MVCDSCIVSVPVHVCNINANANDDDNNNTTNYEYKNNNNNNSLLMILDDGSSQSSCTNNLLLPEYNYHVHFVVAVCCCCCCCGDSSGCCSNNNRQTEVSDDEQKRVPVNSFQTFFHKVSASDINKAAAFDDPSNVSDAMAIKWFVSLFSTLHVSVKEKQKDVSIQSEFRWDKICSNQEPNISFLVKRKGENGLSRVVFSCKMEQRIKDSSLLHNCVDVDCLTFNSRPVQSCYECMALTGSSLHRLFLEVKSLRKKLVDSNNVLENWKQSSLSLSDELRDRSRELLENFAVLVNKKNEEIVALREELSAALKAKESLCNELESASRSSLKRKRPSFPQTSTTTEDDERADQQAFSNEQIELLAKGKPVMLSNLSKNEDTTKMNEPGKSVEPWINELGAMVVSSVNDALDDGESTSSEILI